MAKTQKRRELYYKCVLFKLNILFMKIQYKDKNNTFSNDVYVYYHILVIY